MESNSVLSFPGSLGQFALGEFNGPRALVTNAWAPFAEPVRQRIVPALAIALIASGAVITITPPQGAPTIELGRSFNEPVRQKRGLGAHLQQALIAPVLNPETQITQSLESRWHYPWSEPVRIKPRLLECLQQFAANDTVPFPAGNNIGWFAPLNDPVRVKLRLQESLQQFTAYSPNTTVIPGATYESPWHFAWSEPVRVKLRLQEGLQQFTAYTPGSAIVPGPGYESQWHYAWSEPVRIKPRLLESLQQFFTSDTTPFPTGRNFGWYKPFNEPVRIRPRLLEGLQQFFSYTAESGIVRAWYAPFRDPVRIPPRLLEGLQQFTTNDTTPIPTGRNLGWFARLQEPVKLKPGLGAWLQDYDLQKVPRPPSSADLIEGWYTFMNEPVRQLAGLREWLQQFFAYHPRILPTPTVTAVMDAVETNEDVALIGVYVYNAPPPTAPLPSAHVSVVEIQAIDGGWLSVEES